MVLLATFIGSVLIILVSFECGLLLGRWRSRQPDPEPQLPARMIISSVLSLLAFMLGFTFGMAVSHFDSRDQALHEEAIAIRTAYHRAALLPEPQRATVRDLLRQYVDLRVQGPRSSRLDEFIAQLREIQEQIWAQAVAAESKDGRPMAPTLLLQSLNGVIDENAEKVLTNMRARIPFGVWVVLYGITVVAIAAAGYHSGLLGARRRSIASLAYALVFSAVIVMIADVDGPKFGHFETSRQTLIELQMRLNQPKP